MIVVVDCTDGYETHSFLSRCIRVVTVPFLNRLPSKILKTIMRVTSNDAATVVARGGSVHAVEVMYTRYHRRLFSRGPKEGLADLFWHHCISQPKAIRNRLKVCETILEEEIGRAVAENDGMKCNRSPVVLSVGCGSARALIHVLRKLNQKNSNEAFKVITIDRDPRAIALGKRIAGQSGLETCFDWMNEDAQKIDKLIADDSVDIVEMVGLLDYWREDKAVAVLGSIRKKLVKHGVLVVANVHLNPEMSFVERTGWPRMHYRDPTHLGKILERAGFTGEPLFIFEPLKIHCIVIARK